MSEPNSVEPTDYCINCDRTQPVISRRWSSGMEWRCKVCNSQTDFDHFDDFDDEGESVGSCENCGSNLYKDDDPELCDQCLFYSGDRSGEES